MNLNEYQAWTLTTAVYPDAGTGSFRETLYLSLGLGSEVGEFQGKIKKIIRGDTVDPESVVAEASDVLWYLTRLCASMGITLEELAKYNHMKLSARKEKGTIKGDGDNR